MKKFISAITAMMFLAVTITPLASCGDDDDPTPDPDPDPTPEVVKPKITISQGEITETTITVTFNPDENVASYKYAIGTISDESAFIAGTYTKIVEVTGKESKSIVFNELEAGTSYTIYAQAENEDKVKSDLAKLTIATEEISTMPIVAIEAHSIKANRILVTTTPNEYCFSYRVVLADEDFYDYYEVEKDPISFMETYGTEYTEEKTINWGSYPGYYDYEYWYLILPYDENGVPGDLIIEKLVSEPHNPATDLDAAITFAGSGEVAKVNINIKNGAVGFICGSFYPTILTLPNDQVIYGLFYGQYTSYFEGSTALTFQDPLSVLIADELVFAVVPVDDDNEYNGAAVLFDFTTLNASSEVVSASTVNMENVDYTKIINNIREPKVIKKRSLPNKFFILND